MIKTTQDALAAIAGVCDHAGTWDGAGFGKFDSDFGHKLARAGQAEGWTEKQHAAAKRLCHKYRKQLASHGFDPAALAEEEFSMVKQRAPRAEPPAAAGYVRPTKPIDGFPNRFAGRCGCGARVQAGMGRCTKQDGRWFTYCQACAEPTSEADRAASVEAARRAVAEIEADPLVRIRVVGPNGEALPARPQAGAD
jgi:hypothetical protein